MQTSSLTPITLYCSDEQDAPSLLPQLPAGSISTTQQAEIASHWRTILITHDTSSARQASQWIEQQPPHRHAQMLLILPEGESRLNPPCRMQHRPFKLNHLTRFLHASRALPALPESLKLTEIETSLIEQLHIASEAVSHETLMHNVWGHKTELDTHTLETHLYRLRKKLEKTELSITTEEGSYQLHLSSHK